MNNTLVEKRLSTARICANCVYSDMNGDEGECRKSPPIIFGDYNRVTVWPRVFAEQWCGEQRSRGTL